MLLRKMLRDLKEQKSQFFSIFFMCFLGMYLYAGINGEWRGMQLEGDALYQETNLVDGWVYGEVHPLSKEVEQVITQTEARLMIPMKHGDHSLQGYAVASGEISSMMIVEGKPYQQGEKGIWLDKEYAQANHLQVGDEVTLHFGEQTITRPILGLGYHPEYVYAISDGSALLPDHTTTGFFFLSKAAEPILQNMNDNLLLLKSSVSEAELKQLFDQTDLNYMTRGSHPSVTMLQDEISQHKAVGDVFPVIFFLIAMLTTLNTMRKMILHQQLQLGTLKALGFTKRTLYVHYCSHILFISSLGCVLGTALGPLTLPNLIYGIQKEMYTLPNWQGKMDGSVIWLCAIAIISSALICIASIHREMKECAASCMRPVNPTGFQQNRFASSSHRMFYFHWNCRDLLRNRSRALMALIGIFGCSALLVGALGMMDSIQRMLKDEYEVIQNYQTKVDLQQPAEQDVKRWETQYDATMLQEMRVQLLMDGKREGIMMRVMSNTKHQRMDAQSPSLDLPEVGVSISKKYAKLHDLKQGETIAFQLAGEKQEHQAELTMMHQVPLGQGIQIDAKEYERITGQNFSPTMMLSDHTDIKLEPGMEQITMRADSERAMDELLEAMIMLIGVLIMAAFVLGAVVLYNFTSLSYYERFREMATLKVLGFSNRRIAHLMMSQNIMLCTIGVIFGLPFGYAIVSFMSNTLSSDMDMLVRISLRSYGLALVFTMVWCMLSQHGFAAISNTLIWLAL